MPVGDGGVALVVIEAHQSQGSAPPAEGQQDGVTQAYRD